MLFYEKTLSIAFGWTVLQIFAICSFSKIFHTLMWLNIYRLSNKKYCNFSVILVKFCEILFSSKSFENKDFSKVYRKFNAIKTSYLLYILQIFYHLSQCLCICFAQQKKWKLSEILQLHLLVLFLNYFGQLCDTKKFGIRNF